MESEISSRAELIDALRLAAELEHGLMAQYLFAAYSLKRYDYEGLAPEQLERVRRWASLITLVARQEMEHLGLALNLLSAIGGTPSFSRPNMPQPSGYYGAACIKLTLTRCDLETVKRFQRFEAPDELAHTGAPECTERAPEPIDQKKADNWCGRKGVGREAVAAKLKAPTAGGLLKGAPHIDQLYGIPYRSVQELYEKIANGFERLTEKMGERKLFVGKTVNQIFGGPSSPQHGTMNDLNQYGLDIISVNDLASAKQAVRMIVEQGEGIRVPPSYKPFTHFCIFTRIRGEMEEHGLGEKGARAVVPNPMTVRQPDVPPTEKVSLIDNPHTLEVAKLFNQILRGDAPSAALPLQRSGEDERADGRVDGRRLLPFHDDVRPPARRDTDGAAGLRRQARQRRPRLRAVGRRDSLPRPRRDVDALSGATRHAHRRVPTRRRVGRPVARTAGAAHRRGQAFANLSAARLPAPQHGAAGRGLARELVEHRADDGGVKMLRLEFEGYYQMRMATDPDPTDEKRGVSGYTFALAGEPDFDAKIHFQPDEEGVYERDFGPSNKAAPRVGVTVRRASLDGQPRPDLVGARVALLDAQIIEHNGILTRNDLFIIDPLRVRVTPHAADNESVLLERDDWLNPANPQMPQWEATSPMLLRRQPKRFVTNSPEVAAATGLPDPSNKSLIANRTERRESLEALLKEITRKKEKTKTGRASPRPRSKRASSN